MTIPFYQVDAFTKEVFHGNPAAVCLLDAWPGDDTLQAVAAENNLSETAFLVPLARGRYALRWFTPALEVDLCGHATLASAFVVFSFVDGGLSVVEFETSSGLLTVSREDDLLWMDFPARRPEPYPESAALAAALGARPREVLKSRDLMAVFDEEGRIRDMTPDFEALKGIRDAFAVIVTAPGRDCDFVSRFFAPNAGVPEDPVTGSSHSTLIPYWAGVLGRKRLHARQLSRRGGELFCEDGGDRVRIGGHAVLYARGELCL
ncbi:MAG TPA: PhzF family phenazine biosynthesis protein [Syntrophales bacterium]|nr:PhzF family phenazine biosynthesis protein [Syntrophales bacterium]HOM06458.1 PhzF family phenazine biosynthesis protein [Syntrophales bacterium]HON99091.1 PhzF family phenazine biosynthesis protein [Syntrophales bacterium]HPC00199.1 PhzF family phenazine biosynthesis protein [Syntrophales bacterium]HPQ05862.1 PhzF family phenazine biosynthesis protein [Syntrophales bacterium]